MKLDFIDHINDFDESVVRLYDFNQEQSIAFCKLIEEEILTKRLSVNLSNIDFIEPRNCKLVLQVTQEDEGIVTLNKQDFFCNLTLGSYKSIVKLLQPFCNKETKGYQYLYDLDCLIDFLFAPYGSYEE